MGTRHCRSNFLASPLSPSRFYDCLLLLLLLLCFHQMASKPIPKPNPKTEPNPLWPRHFGPFSSSWVFRSPAPLLAHLSPDKYAFDLGPCEEWGTADNRIRIESPRLIKSTLFGRVPCLPKLLAASWRGFAATGH